jgi:hemerythrin-like domain-containing protein
MCEHCGCRGVEPIAELMDEHLELLDHAGEVRRLLDRGDLDSAWTRMAALAGLLVRHVEKEEAGLFTALREQGDFVEPVAELEAEHASFDELVSELDRESPTLRADLERIFVELSEHIDKENLGIFPVAVVTLGADGWNTVARAHEHDHKHGHDHHAHSHSHAHAHA